MNTLYPSDYRHRDLVNYLLDIYRCCIEKENTSTATIDGVADIWRQSARNFIHYLAMRTFDLRSIHEALTSRGLSSLRYAEPHTLNNLGMVINLLKFLQGEPQEDCIVPASIDYQTSRNLLAASTSRLFVGSER